MREKHIMFGPMEIKKEDGLFYSCLLVEDGPPLMKNNKTYTKIFKKMIKVFPIENVSFYNATYTSYKIKTRGRRDVVINGIKGILLKEKTGGDRP